MAGGPAILIPAAGASSRMRGPDKLVQLAGTVPLLRRVAGRALATGARVLVTLPPPPHDAGRRAALDGLPVDLIGVPDAAEGMAASLRAGAGTVAAWPGVSALMVLLGDMPDLEPADLSSLFARFAAEGGDTPLRATAEDGRPGQPVIFPPRLFPALSRVTGDRGGRDILRAEPRLVHHPLPGDRALVDLDTPEAWAAWRDRTA